MQLKDIAGQRFGLLVAQRYLGQKKWQLICDCGAETAVLTVNLHSGNTRSCGCLRRRPAKNRTHGRRNTPEFQAWAALRNRCTNQNLPGYPRYGGRGITFTPTWSTFEQFYADMGDRPTPQHSLDRIDNDGNYEPGNCRWATKEEQSMNRNHCSWHTYRGRTQSLTRWATELGINRDTLKQRLRAGWSVEDALSTNLLRPEATPETAELPGPLSA